VKYVTPAEVLSVLDEGTFVAVRGPYATHLEEGMELQVVGPPGRGGQRAVLGTARVLPAGGAKGIRKALRSLEVAKVMLDQDALSAEGDLFAVVPASVLAKARAQQEEEEGGAEPPKAEPKPARRALQGTISVATGLRNIRGGNLLIRNTDSINWTRCYVVKRLRFRGLLGDLPKGTERVVSSFSPSAEFLVENGEVGVFCNEGELRARLPRVR